jgi:hypothetical protein
MRIFDVNNIEITSPDLSRGYFKKDKIFVKHHEAVEPVEEQWHYEVVAEYPNGGKDIKKVIDVVGVKAQDPWDEYEDIRRYVEYPENEVTDELNNPTISQRLDKIEKTLQEFSKHIENYKNNYTGVGR